jgi:hypothetical protein
MFDGDACDTCFVCGLLTPELARDDVPCAQCGGRMVYRPATHMDEIALERLLANLCAAYRATATRATLTALAEALHRFAPLSLDLLERQPGPTISELRQAFAAL